MSFTDAALGWLCSLSATFASSPFRLSSPADHDFADWLQISPEPSPPPLQDVSSSTRVNLPSSSQGSLNYDYGFPESSTRSEAGTSSGSPTSAIFNQHHRMISLDSTTTTLINSPSPRSLAFLSPPADLVRSYMTSPRHSPSMFASPSCKLIQDLHNSPFGNLYDDPNAVSMPAHALFDESPVVRADKLQDYLREKEIPKSKVKKRRKRTKQIQQPISFVEQLRSAPTLVDQHASSSLKTLTDTGPSEAAAPAALPLLSPCKLVLHPAQHQEIIERDPPSASIAPVDLPAQKIPAPVFATPPRSLAFLDAPLSPLTPLTPTSSPPPSPLNSKAKAKRPNTDRSPSLRRSKRPRRNFIIESSPIPADAAPSILDSPGYETPQEQTCRSVYTNRTLPDDIEISTNFPLYYRRFPASAFLQPAGSEPPCTLFKREHPGGTYNPPRSILDLYTPRFVRGKGVEKVGLCPICIEPCSRGGENKKNWLAMKFSAFKYYHMQYAHGISASTGAPFSPPTAFRTVPRPNPGKKEKHQIQQGKCHKCAKWVAVEGIKDMESKVPELHWWKHAATCHHDSTLEGEGDYFEEDDVYSALLALEAEPEV